MTQLSAIRTGRLVRRAGVLVAGMTVAAVLATGCQAGSSRGEFGENQQILAQCDPSAPPASFVQIDGTGSSVSKAITAERMEAIESIVQTTAICSGHLRVQVFAASSVDTRLLFEAPLRLDGATDTARLKRVPALVSDAMGQIRKAYNPAVKALSSHGSDIAAQLRHASEWIAQLGGNFKLRAYLLTDGFENTRVNLVARALSRQEATALAAQVEVPDLPGASVVIAGLGRVVGNPPSSAMVEGLIAYYGAVCRKTNAADCLAVTDYTTGR
jgi:hypothetical protein